MALCLSTTSRPQSTKRTGQSTISDGSLAKQQNPHIVSIGILDDNSLLNIFYLYRPSFLGEEESDSNRLLGGGQWKRERWWYRLAHVCQRWRNIILGSASYLRLSLVCTTRTPVAKMLAHSPPLPLTVDYCDIGYISKRDEEEILLCLEQRHRIRHLRLGFRNQFLRKLVLAIGEEYPILEYLILFHSRETSPPFVLHETLQAPHLLHLALDGFACPTRPRLHPTAASLVTLSLVTTHPSAYFQPNILLQWMSFTPQLENLEVLFTFPVPNRDVERQLTRTPITTHLTLPNLRSLVFRGVGAYLEAVVCRTTAPRLETVKIRLFKQLTFSVPRLLQFINTAENLRLYHVGVIFRNEQVTVVMPYREAVDDIHSCVLKVDCWHLDWQVSSVAQIVNVLSQVFPLEHLTLSNRREAHSRSSEEHNALNRIEWRNLLRSFSNVKTLRVEGTLFEDISRCLQLEDGELPLEILPELQELTYFGDPHTLYAFTPFINARRQKAGRPLRLIRHGPVDFGPPAITSLSNEAGNDIQT